MMDTSEAAAPLVLHQLPAAMGLPISESPPCAKVEVYLALTGTPYTQVVGDTRRSPNRMVPFVEWPDGELLAESGDILARIEATAGLDAGLDPDRLARGAALAERAEMYIYDATLYDRFVTPEGAPLQRPLTTTLVSHFVPRFVAPLVAMYVDWTQVRRARRGPMSDPEQGYASALAVLEDTVALLGDDPYLCGEQPSTVDCAIWPLVVHAAATPNRTVLRDAPATYPTLIDWVLRFGDRSGFPIERRQLHADGPA